MGEIGGASVLIIEDRRNILDRLSSAVAASDGLWVAGIAEYLSEGLELLYSLKPRILLVDLGLPDGSGVEAVAAASASDWQIDSLVVSIFGDEARVVEAICAGASGYILKGGQIDDITDAIHSVLRGGSPISPAIARHLLTIVQKERLDTNTPTENTLTERELEILQAVARGYKRREIAEKLGIASGTVGNHVNNIYKKLGVGSNTQAISHATRLGLI